MCTYSIEVHFQYIVGDVGHCCIDKPSVPPLVFCFAPPKTLTCGYLFVLLLVHTYVCVCVCAPKPFLSHPLSPMMRSVYTSTENIITVMETLLLFLFESGWAFDRTRCNIYNVQFYIHYRLYSYCYSYTDIYICICLCLQYRYCGWVMCFVLPPPEVDLR